MDLASSNHLDQGNDDIPTSIIDAFGRDRTATKPSEPQHRKHQRCGKKSKERGQRNRIHQSVETRSLDDLGFVPSAENGFKFQFGPKTDRTAEELNALFELEPEPAQASDPTKNNEGAKDGRDWTKDPGFMPSEANGFRFEFGSKMGRCAEELNELFRAPTNCRLSELPHTGLANESIAQMEQDDAEKSPLQMVTMGPQSGGDTGRRHIRLGNLLTKSELVK